MDLSALTVDEADNTIKSLSISNSFNARDSVSLTSIHSLMPSTWAEIHISSASFDTDNTVDLAMICESSDVGTTEVDDYALSTDCIDGDEDADTFPTETDCQHRNSLSHSTGNKILFILLYYSSLIVDFLCRFYSELWDE